MMSIRPRPGLDVMSETVLKQPSTTANGADAKNQERYERILAAAREELETKAADSVKMTAIARRAKMPVGALYQHFENKNVLLVAVAARITDDTGTGIQDALAMAYELPWRDAVQVALEQTHGYLRNNESYRRIVLAVRFTKEYKDATVELIFRSAELMALHPAFAAAGLSEQRAREISRTCLATAYATEELVLDSEPDDINDWISEAQNMIIGYLGTYLD